MPKESNTDRGSKKPFRQQITTKVTTKEKSFNKPSGTDKYTKHTTQDKYVKKNGADEKVTWVKTTTCDKYSSGPSGQKVSVCKKKEEDKYMKTSGFDAHLKTKTSSKDTYVTLNDDSKRKGSEKKPISQSTADDHTAKKIAEQNKPPSYAKTLAAEKRAKWFPEKACDSTKAPETNKSSAWTSRPYANEQKKKDKNDRKQKALSNLGPGAVAGAGILAATGPRKRDSKENNNGRNNRNNADKERERDQPIWRRHSDNRNKTSDNNSSEDGCCILM